MYQAKKRKYRKDSGRIGGEREWTLVVELVCNIVCLKRNYEKLCKSRCSDEKIKGEREKKKGGKVREKLLS